MTPVVARALGAILIAVVAIASTGGLSALGFWYDVVPDYLSVLMASIGLGVAFIPVLPLIPIGRILRRAMPGWGRRVDLTMRAGVLVVPGTIYFLAEGTVGVTDARLPFEDPRFGAVMVMALAALAYSCVHLLTARLEVPERFPRPRPTSGPTPWADARPEPSEEFWSPDPIQGWRVWKWNGRVLKGSYERDWPLDRLKADCVVCDDPPGWDCPCGIYAMKDHRSLPSSRSGPTIVGKVELSGRVVEHEDGYRASNARITELWIDDPLAARWIALAYPEVRVWAGSPVGESPPP